MRSKVEIKLPHKFRISHFVWYMYIYTRARQAEGVRGSLEGIVISN